ncbi:hypothetical protein [Sphingobium aromaticiconvertens]|uniref:hypothetical protein n=1 Tax=Sphingobium aromaticiconvertens TaxID=365341 RepID=UPI003AFAFB12
MTVTATAQGELFRLDSPLTGEIRGERSLMAFPFFALSKNAWMKPPAYATPTVTIEVPTSARDRRMPTARPQKFVHSRR